MTEPDWAALARDIIPAETQTFSKRWPGFDVRADHARGGHVYGTDGREYIDWMAALGPISLGYCDPDVDKAVHEQVDRGSIFSLPTALEVTVSQQLLDLVPGAEMVRFGKHGSDVTSAAVRLARHITSRDKVISLGYHGWHDWACPNQNGIPPGVVRDSVRLDDVDAACVIVEPDLYWREHLGGLFQLRQQCDERGALLIFDEVLSGFRLALGGAQEFFGVRADLACFAKAMGNGYPISAITGPRRFMKFMEEIGYSGTFMGEAISLAAASATMAKMRRLPVLPRMWDIGTRLAEGFGEAAERYGVDAQVHGYPPRLVLRFGGDRYVDPILPGLGSTPNRDRFALGMARRGVLCRFGFMPCWAHSDRDVELTIQAIEDTMAEMSKSA